MIESKHDGLIRRSRIAGLALSFALTGCAASNAVLDRAIDQRRVQHWVPEVSQAVWQNGVWEVSGQAWYVMSDMRLPAGDWRLCLSGALSVAPDQLDAPACPLTGEPGSVEVAERISGEIGSLSTFSETLSAGERPAGRYLAATHEAPLLAGVPSPQVYYLPSAEDTRQLSSLAFRAYQRPVVTREGNPFWYGLMPMAVVADIVIAPVQFVSYVRHVRRQNLSRARQ